MEKGVKGGKYGKFEVESEWEFGIKGNKDVQKVKYDDL